MTKRGSSLLCTEILWHYFVIYLYNLLTVYIAAETPGFFPRELIKYNLILRGRIDQF